jgi:hypothetical protein
MGAAKPFHEMTLAEYLETGDAQRVSRKSVLALEPREYTVLRLIQLDLAQLRTLAVLWGVAQGGAKSDLARRILRRRDFREQLASQPSSESLCQLSRKQLCAMAKEAGLFYSALKKRDIATSLIQWRDAERKRAARLLGEARHFDIVQRALFRGLSVPSKTREGYGLDSDGRIERQIAGLPRSVVVRAAPEAVEAARKLSQTEFAAWVADHPETAQRVGLMALGSLLDGGKGFWLAVHRAFETESQGCLFHCSRFPTRGQRAVRANVLRRLHPR